MPRIEGAEEMVGEIPVGTDSGGSTPASKAWIPRFLLVGSVPNPADARLTVAFQLSSWQPASLELYDVQGRRLLNLGVGGVGTDPQWVNMGDGLDLASGVYFVRLRQGPNVATRKVLVVAEQ